MLETVWCERCSLELMRRSTRNFNIPPPPGQTPGIWTFEDWIVQIPAPYGQNGVQMPYLIVGFVCQMPLLKNNRLRLLSSLTRLVYMFRDPLYDGAVFTRLELLQKHNFNIETIRKWLKLNYLSRTMSISKCIKAALTPKHGKGCLTRNT